MAARALLPGGGRVRKNQLLRLPAGDLGNQPILQAPVTQIVEPRLADVGIVEELQRAFERRMALRLVAGSMLTHRQIKPGRGPDRVLLLWAERQAGGQT